MSGLADRLKAAPQPAKAAEAKAAPVRHHTPILPALWRFVGAVFREAAILAVVLAIATGAGFLAHYGLAAERNGVAFDAMLLVDMVAPMTGIHMAADSAILSKLPEGQPPLQTIASHLIAGFVAYGLLTGARALHAAGRG